MDNASKALLMAGGMLMAIIVITIFLVMYNNISNIEEIKKTKSEEEIIEKFNDPFMSYNKKVMYGTDLISVLNLALDNNKKYNAVVAEEYFVDVSFKLNADLMETTDTYTLDATTGKYSKHTDEEPKFEGNRMYSIKNNKEAIESQIIGKLSEKEQITNVLKKEGAIIKKYEIKSNYIYDLKRKTFTCKNVEVDSAGRIKSMSFEQK